MPLRLFWVISVLAATMSSARAQAPPAAVGSPATAAVSGPVASYSLTRADTARAIRLLFRSRRGGGIGWLSFGTAGILGSTLPALQSTSVGVWTPGVVASSGFMLIGLNKRIQFRPGRERQLLRELAATGHLPASVSRRLRGKFEPVQGAASDYNPLLAKDIAPSNATALLTPAQLQERAHADTLRAIARLFERRRKGGKVWTYVGLSGALAMVRILISGSSDNNSVDGGGVAAVAVGGIGVPVVVGVLNLTAYNEARQEDVERTFSAGKPLPRKIRLRLKRKDLQPYD